MTDFGGIRTPVSGTQHIRTAGAGPAGSIDATLFVGTLVTAGSKAHEWNAIFSLQNYSAFGDNCGYYAKADKYSDGATWGGCIEVQDTTGRGPVWGLEIDMMTKPDAGQRNRWGVGLVIGRNADVGPAAYVDKGFAVVPFGFKPDTALVGVGMSVEVPARSAAIAVLPGQKIMLDGPEGAITVRFDPVTGFIEFALADKPVFQFQMGTGAFYILGKRVV